MQTLDNTMNLTLEVGEWLTQNKTKQEVQQKLKTGLVLLEYMNGEISIGEIAEHYGKTVEEAMTWINQIGFSTSRIMSDNLDTIALENMKQQLENNGVQYP